MSIYVIGDIQGCLDELQQLLKKIRFSADKDVLWFTGDLVNRGPKSLEVLRFVKSLEDNAVTVLGNHDLHMLAIVYGLEKQRPSDTFDEIINASDKQSLMQWVAQLPLIHCADNDQLVMVHAGIYPSWEINDAKKYASEVETILQSDRLIEFLSNMYGNLPDKWSEDLQGSERLRFITNTFTRMRFCTRDLRLDLKSSVAPGKQVDSLLPWYHLRKNNAEKHQIFFGHWSTLGLINENGMHCLDTGCLWGGELSALKLTNSHELFQIDCKGQQRPF